MRRLIAWISGWTTTLDIMINDPELYKILKTPFNPDEFEEVGRP